MTEMQNPEAPAPEPVAEQASVSPDAQPEAAVQNAAAAQNEAAVQPTVEELSAMLGVPTTPFGGAAPQAPVSAETSETSAEAKPKRRIRSGTLFAGAVVLGVLGGVGTGYAVQYARPATPLPPLAATQPQYAPAGTYQGSTPAGLPASQDDATRTEGDLTKLLLPMPAGASDADSDWTDQMISVDQDASLCDDQSSCYTDDFDKGVEAIADTEWTTSDGFFVEIRMYRFRAGDSETARDWESGNTGGNTLPTPTGIQASGYEYHDKYGENDDHMEAVHGDILVSVWVTSADRMPNPSLVDGVITQQMARL